MDIQIYGANFILRENEDSRKEVFPYILHIDVEGGMITIFLERKDYEKLKEEIF